MGNGTKRPNYAAKFCEAIRRNPSAARRGSVPQIRIAHYAECGYVKGRACSCNPPVTAVDLNDAKPRSQRALYNQPLMGAFENQP
jgi:hypothetical protein